MSTLNRDKPTDPFFALGVLRGKIRKRLATRYLVMEQGERALSHDRLKGHISYGGVVVDGEFISFKQAIHPGQGRCLSPAWTSDSSRR